MIVITWMIIITCKGIVTFVINISTSTRTSTNVNYKSYDTLTSYNNY